MALVGLKNIHYAVISADSDSGTTYDTPKKIGNAVSVDINPSTQKAALYGDDMAVATATAMGEVTVTIETTDIPLEDLATLLGATADSTTGEIIFKSTDVAPYVGLAFESEKHDGGIRCMKLLKGKFAQTQETINTKSEQLQYQVPKIEGTFVARQSDGGWKQFKDVTAGTSTATWYSTF